MPVPVDPSKPETPAQWREHAEELHRRGLEVIDAAAQAGGMPTDVAQTQMLYAQTLFTAASVGVAMATHLGGPTAALVTPL